MSRVLVVDDEPIVREVVVKYLENEGFETLQAGDGLEARALLEEKLPSAVVLDVMMPRLDGLELCRWIRARSDVPVIMLTALGEEADRIVGLELGADDYVTKPFSPRELAVRVKAVVRRATAGAPKAERIEAGDLRVAAATREVAKAGQPLRLTATELDLLWFLASHPLRGTSALAAIAGALLLARWILTAIDRLHDSSARLAAGDLTARAPQQGVRELAELGSSFNQMAAAVEELFDARRQLVAWASHDLRTPLASINAMLEALEDGLVPLDRYLAPLRDRVRTLSQLVDDLFELARIDAGVLTVELTDARLDHVVASCLRGFEAQARLAQVRLE